jgi:hypothetical protein
MKSLPDIYRSDRVAARRVGRLRTWLGMAMAQFGMH